MLVPPEKGDFELDVFNLCFSESESPLVTLVIRGGGFGPAKLLIQGSIDRSQENNLSGEQFQTLVCLTSFQHLERMFCC